MTSDIPIEGTRARIDMPGFETKPLTITIVSGNDSESSHAMLWLVSLTCSAKADFELLK